MARRNRMNFSIFEKDLLQELYNKNKNDLSSGNKQLRKNVIDKIVLLFNGTPGIKAERNLDQIKGRILAIEKSLIIPQRINARRNTTCGGGSNHQSRATSLDTEIEQPKTHQEIYSSIEQIKYELLQMQLKNENIRGEILHKKLEKLVKELSG